MSLPESMGSIVTCGHDEKDATSIHFEIDFNVAFRGAHKIPAMGQNRAHGFMRGNALRMDCRNCSIPKLQTRRVS